MILRANEVRKEGGMRKIAVIIGILGIFILIQLLGAQTWTASKRLTWLTGDSYHAAEAVDSEDNIHVVWQDDSQGSSFEIFYKRSTDGGTTWPEYKRLTWNAEASRYSSIDVDSNNNIHLVWDNMISGRCEIFYRKGIQ
jgi:hypothetical protein